MIAGLMIGRGALIKPWIFTEIKEQRFAVVNLSQLTMQTLGHFCWRETGILP
jgi:hypothetical protein